MVYTVTYFNPLGNCDNVIHVEADNEVDAALIAHADFWVTSKPFNLSDYNVVEYSPEYVVRKEDILEKGKKRQDGWTEDILKEKKLQALKEYVLEDWKYGEKSLDELKTDVIDKFGTEMGPDNNTTTLVTLVTDILSKTGELEGILKF